MILNRAELFRGYSLNRFNEICNILSVNKIKYKYKVKIMLTLKTFLMK